MPLCLTLFWGMILRDASVCDLSGVCDFSVCDLTAGALRAPAEGPRAGPGAPKGAPGGGISLHGRADPSGMYWSEEGPGGIRVGVPRRPPFPLMYGSTRTRQGFAPGVRDLPL